MTIGEVIDAAQGRISAAIAATAPMWEALSDGTYSHIVMWSEIDQVPRIFMLGSGIVALRDDQIR